MHPNAHRSLTTVSAVAAAAALFQIWVLRLSPEQAAAFTACRFTELLDCYTSLYQQGALLLRVDVPYWLFGVLLFQLALCLYAWIVQPDTRAVLLAWAGLAAVPIAGLALYQVAYALAVAHATSVSALVLLGTTACMAWMAWRARGRTFGGAAGGVLLAAGQAALAAWLLTVSAHGGTALDRRPAVSFPRFAHNIARQGMATLGTPATDAEVLVYFDPQDPTGGALLRNVVAQEAEYGDRVRFVLYADVPLVSALQAARESGRVKDLLERLAQGQSLGDALAGIGVDAKDLPVAPGAHQAQWRDTGIDEFPAILWRGGRSNDPADLRRAVQESLRP